MPQMWPMYWEMIAFMSIAALMILANKSNFLCLSNQLGILSTGKRQENKNKMILQW